MNNIDWINLPYDHSGRWSKIYNSIMNPSAKITWPQFIMEMVIYHRSKYLKDYPKIQKGPNWSEYIQKQVRSLSQQAYMIVKYFPHPDDEPLIVPAFKNYFRQNRVMKIGQYRKTRQKDGKCLVTQDEKDLVKGIACELNRLKENRNRMMQSASKTTDVDNKEKKQISYRTILKNG